MEEYSANAERGLQHRYCEQFYDPGAVTKRSLCPSSKTRLTPSLSSSMETSFRPSRT